MFSHLSRTIRDERGFTLIELLVVILIIGILAAIAIPSFLNQRGKGVDASAKSNAKTVQTALETFYTDNNTYNCGADAAACVTALKGIEPTVPSVGAASGNIDALTGDATTYSVTVIGGDGRKFTLGRLASGDVTRTCTVPNGVNTGGCQPGGKW
jgi:type IV pilus assembly protein PilA